MKSSIRKVLITGFISLSVGIFIFLFTLIFNSTLEANVSESFHGLIYGISVGLMLAGTVFIIICLVKSRHPLLRRRFEVQLNDERTQMLYQKSGYIAFRSLPIIGALFIVLAYAFNQPTIGVVLILFEYTIICVFFGSVFFLKNKM